MRFHFYGHDSSGGKNLIQDLVTVRPPPWPVSTAPRYLPLALAQRWSAGRPLGHERADMHFGVPNRRGTVNDPAHVGPKACSPLVEDAAQQEHWFSIALQRQ